MCIPIVYTYMLLIKLHVLLLYSICCVHYNNVRITEHECNLTICMYVLPVIVFCVNAYNRKGNYYICTYMHTYIYIYIYIYIRITFLRKIKIHIILHVHTSYVRICFTYSTIQFTVFRLKIQYAYVTMYQYYNLIITTIHVNYIILYTTITTRNCNVFFILLVQIIRVVCNRTDTLSSFYTWRQCI